MSGTDGVSPVIAVILMLAITVTVSAVIGAAVLNKAQEPESSTDGATVSAVSYLENGTKYLKIQLVSNPSGENVSYSTTGAAGNLSSIGDAVILKQGTDFKTGDSINIIVDDAIIESIETDFLVEPPTTTTVFFEGFEDGDSTEYTSVGDSDGTNYYFNNTTDAKSGTYAYNHHLKADGAAAYYIQKNSTNINVTPSNKVTLSSWFKVFRAKNGEIDKHARAELRVNMTTVNGTTEIIRYRLASIIAQPADSPSSLMFTVENHAAGTTGWRKMSRNINDDLNAGGYTNVTRIHAVYFVVSTPSTFGGTDAIGIRHDDVNISETG